MRIRPFVYASLALVAAAPALARAAVTVATTTIQVPPGDVAAGATVAIVCNAEGNTTSSMLGSVATTIDRIDVTVTGGTVAPGQIAGAVSRTCTAGTGTCSWLEGSVAWTTPAVEGALTATCTITYTDTKQFGSPTTGTRASSAVITTVAGAALPPIVGAVSGPGEVLVGSSAAFSVVASDPNVPAQPLVYAWTATGGAITPDAANPGAATWLAPSDAGIFEITATVSNGVSSNQARKTVSVGLATHQAGLPLALSAPRRIAASPSGALFAVDGQQGAVGRVALVTARGELRGFATLPEPALAVTVGAGFLWVTTTKGSLYKVDAASGRTLGKLNLSGGPLLNPLGVAYDATSMTLWVAETDANRVRRVTPDGATAGIVDAVNGAPLLAPVDVAIDASTSRAWILVGDAKPESGLAPGEQVAAARFLHAFALSGGYLGSYVARGGALGQLSRGGGVAVGAQGRVYLSDAFQGTVQVVSATGAPVGAIGAFGERPGQLLNPTGLALMGNGDLAVANTTLGKIDRFGTGSALPSCAGDSDCDGLPDGWELANRLDPGWAGDALVDLDGDGLTNAEELAAGTDPRNADTDGDGYGDGDELLAGFDPRNPNDHAVAVSVSGPREVTPGLVRLSAVASGAGVCSFQWTQAGGPPVAIRSATSATPSFIARTAGTYELDAVATCGAASSAPGRVTVVVRNVSPVPEAGGVVVAEPGGAVRLDALGSTDANGDALAFTWDQTLGAPLVGTESGGILSARPRGVGLYAFQVTVADPAGGSAVSEVPVLVTSGPAPTAIAAALPSEVEVGAPVVLDASASLGGTDATFSWRQVSGPEAALSAADRAVASFVAPAPGRYAFEVSFSHGRLRSPPARVEVFVTETGAALPAVTASAPSVVEVNAPVSLEATASAGAVEYAWRQVSGPAAGLSEADRATATLVAFVPGFYVFEVSVKSGAAESRPARVALEARASGKAIPQARVAAAAGDAWVGQLVFLDGRASSGASGFRWTQVGGPWTALGAQAAVTSFRPLVPGAYAFELVVDDGAVRSAPARVEINVVEGVQ